jgi:hypothetical protein
VPPVRVALPELDLVGGQRVQRPVWGDQPGIGADPGPGLFDGAVEFGQVAERLGLAAGQRLGPRGRRPGQEVGRAGLRARRDDRAADADLASLPRPPERQRGVRIDGEIPALAAGRAGGEVPAARAVDILADQHP